MKKFLFLFLTIFLIQSCVEPRDYTEKNTPPSANKVLKKVRVNEVGTASYDINYNWTSGKLMSITTSNNSFSFTLQYNGTELNKIIGISGQGTQAETNTSSLVYTNGKLTQVNAIITSPSSQPKIVKSIYTYNSSGMVSQIKSEHYNQSAPTIITETWINDLAYVNSNLSTSSLILHTMGTTISFVTTLSNYDANPNPLHTLPMAFTLANTNYDTTEAGPTGISPNNFKKLVLNVAGTTVADENIVYDYDSNGYPIKSTQSNGYTDYEYISL